MDTIQFDKCIICLNIPNNLDENSELTEEHIVPEFLGGKLILKNVCKACNSRLGVKVEGPLSNNFLFKAYSYFNGIKGKKGKLINPLAGTYTHADGTVRFNNDFSTYQIPEYEVYKHENGGYGFKVSADVKDINIIKNELFKSISRLAAKEGRKINKNKLEEQLKNIPYLAKENTRTIEQPKIEGTITFNFNMVALLAVKIAYEFLAYYSGNMIFNKEFDIYRNSLFYCSLDSSINYTNDNLEYIFKKTLLQNPFMKIRNISELDSIFSKNKTLVIYTKDCCSVRIINFWFNFKFPTSFSSIFIIFSSDSRTGERKIYTERDLYLMV
ncbi:HNH endonuclease [Acinetobacter sp. A47]|uniref:HNH endonuclease n=1 Tax=Acinetobacter sp. A47 TaxID=1561217 RepID=UPI00056E7D52|nr:HNH endonuclease [Acinetobacter sp. A47]